MSKIYNSAGWRVRSLGSTSNRGVTIMRMNYQAAAPEVIKAMMGLETCLARQS